jgi:hypothetical protein
MTGGSFGGRGLIASGKCASWFLRKADPNGCGFPMAQLRTANGMLSSLSTLLRRRCFPACAQGFSPFTR